jgi:hypothetical protein
MAGIDGLHNTAIYLDAQLRDNMQGEKSTVIFELDLRAPLFIHGRTSQG